MRTSLRSAHERVREHAVATCTFVDHIRVHGGSRSVLSQPSRPIAQRMARPLSGRGGRMRAFGIRRDVALGLSRRRTPQLRRREHAVERVRRRLEEGRVPMDGSVVSDGLGWRRSDERGRAGRSVLFMECGSTRTSGRLAVGKPRTSGRSRKKTSNNGMKHMQPRPPCTQLVKDYCLSMECIDRISNAHCDILIL